MLVAIAGHGAIANAATPPGAPEPTLDGWFLLQSDGDLVFTARIPARELPAGDAQAELSVWRWPDTRRFDDGVVRHAGSQPPPPLQAPLDRVVGARVEVVVEDLAVAVIRVHTHSDPRDVDPEDVWVARFDPRPVALTGARQLVFAGFCLFCDQVGMDPLPLGGDRHGTEGSRETCTRLPLDGGELLSTEIATSGNETCMAAVLVAPDGGRRQLPTLCRTDVLWASPRPEVVEHSREHLLHMAWSAGAGPSSPEAWFRADGGPVVVVLNRFRGPSQDRCLARLPAPGEEWHPVACVRGPPSGGY